MTKRFTIQWGTGVVLALGTALTGCSNDSKEALNPISSCDTVNVTYAATIKPLTDQHCALSGCHASGSSNSSGIVLSDYAGLKAIADDGSLLGTLRGQGYILMPLNGPKLDDCTIAKYARWVSAGAPNN